MKPLLLWCALLLACAPAAPLLAQTPVAASLDTRPVQERADAAVVRSAMSAAANGGPIALQQHVPALRQVLERAPASYPSVLREGPVVILRTSGPGSLSPELLASGLGEAVKSRQAVLRIDFNTYPTAALLLASFAIEARQPALSLPYLDRGLALQPENAELTSEKAHALYLLHRPAEGLTLVDAWLAAHPLGLDEDRARLLRSKGFALTELNRLGEAEAAYNASLQLQPNHALALNELAYIRDLRKGRPAAPMESITSDQAPTQPAIQPPPASKQPT